MPNPLRPSGVRELGTWRRVLVVENDADAGELLSMVLGEAGHEVRVVGSARGALAAIAGFLPQVALIDIGLADMNGLELCRLLRQQPELNGCRFVAVTGHAGELAISRSVAAGFDAHVTKPATADGLLAAVNAVNTQSGALRPDAIQG